jgi:hypothetical protein
MKHFCILLLVAWLVACSSGTDAPPADQGKTVIPTDTTPLKDTVAEESPVDPLEIFIDSMEKENFRTDTNRLKKISAWSRIARSPKGLRKEHVYFAAPFPIASENKYFSEPETYFFAKWNPKTAAYKNGEEYLLMTWKIDSEGIKRENLLYLAIFEYNGYFPSYCFRGGDRVYVIINRMISNSLDTQVLAERLKDRIDRSATVYGIHNSHLLRKKNL